MEADHNRLNAVKALHLWHRCDKMSDFTDDEDRQLVQLAHLFSRKGRQILWGTLTQRMKGTTKSKEALRQRLKTLKRTYGRNLEDFPEWFFKQSLHAQKSSQLLRKSRHSTIDVTTSNPRKSESKSIKEARRYKKRPCVKYEPKTSIIYAKHLPKREKPTRRNVTPRFRNFGPTIKSEPLASLLMLASVACTAIHVNEVNG
ncbi:hypothetical protein CCR75_004158 [Bremia lactucae]|uniref:Myb-like domain-containing protein n=1 Tax=Bremia lactucae TaxID=4779 RepID=A0A976IEI0_BRELC|nr:hypothetical protein CCR75_004158 [Bremia lactucae]